MFRTTICLQNHKKIAYKNRGRDGNREEREGRKVWGESNFLIVEVSHLKERDIHFLQLCS